MDRYERPNGRLTRTSIDITGDLEIDIICPPCDEKDNTVSLSLEKYFSFLFREWMSNVKCANTHVIVARQKDVCVRVLVLTIARNTSKLLTSWLAH